MYHDQRLLFDYTLPMVFVDAWFGVRGSQKERPALLGRFGFRQGFSCFFHVTPTILAIVDMVKMMVGASLIHYKVCKWYML